MKIFILFGLFISFILLSIQVSIHNFKIDYIINNLASSINNSELFKNIFVIIAWLGDTYGVILITLFLVIYFSSKKYYKEIYLLIGIMLGTVASSTLTKYIVGRIRPDNMIIEYGGYSFPSGHSTMAVLFYGLLFYILKDKIRNNTLKYFLLIIFIIFAFLIIFSRIYLSVHWFSDVVGGIILGIIWLIIGILIYDKINKK